MTVGKYFSRTIITLCFVHIIDLPGSDSQSFEKISFSSSVVILLNK